MFMVISDRTGCLFTIGNLYCSFPGTRALLCCDGNSPNRRDFGIVAATEAADVGDVGADASADADGSADADVCACGAADDGKSFDLAAVAPFSPNTPPRYLYEFPSAARKMAKECGNFLVFSVTGYFRDARELISPTFCVFAIHCFASAECRYLGMSEEM